MPLTFDMPWEEVTKDDIDKMSQKLGDKMGGWIFHRKVNFDNPTPSIRLKRSQPKYIKSWKNNWYNV